jgi:hypothetical protein
VDGQDDVPGAALSETSLGGVGSYRRPQHEQGSAIEILIENRKGARAGHVLGRWGLLVSVTGHGPSPG